MNRMPKKPHDVDGLVEAAARSGTPTVVYDEMMIRDRCAALRSAISSVPSKLLYALKANSNPALIRILLEEVDGFDAVSPGEVMLLLKLGARPEQIMFSPNYMTDSEMANAVERDVLLNLGELTRLERFGKAYPGSNVSIRLNLWLGAGHHEYVVTGGQNSKFGIPATQLDEAAAIAGRHGLRIVGLHQHIGSGFSNVQDFADAVDLLIEASKMFPEAEFLNVGGGIGIPYRADEAACDLDAMARYIEIAANRPELKSEFWFEPGRFLVAESGVLLTTVTAVKQSGKRTYAGTDSGFNHLIRPVLYGAHHEIFNLSNPTGPLLPYDVAGNICESGDVFARDRHVQEIREGDLLAILDVGAYGVSMASEYNMRPLPEEVLRKADGTSSTIRKRLTPTELVERVILETDGRSNKGDAG